MKENLPTTTDQTDPVDHLVIPTLSERFTTMKACNGTYFVTVIEDTVKNKIIGAATLIRERKFIHNSGSVNGFDNKSGEFCDPPGPM